jgi:hypothetical protein
MRTLVAVVIGLAVMTATVAGAYSCRTVSVMENGQVRFITVCG